MRDAGYDDDICGGITAASCIIGPLVPPSIAMIIYGVIANESIAKLFIAGFIPGVLITLALMAMNYRIAKNEVIHVHQKLRENNFAAALNNLLGNLNAVINYRWYFFRLIQPNRICHCCSSILCNYW